MLSTLSKASMTVAAAALSGCAALQPTVSVTTTIFHGAGATERGPIAVLPADERQAQSLEFRANAQLLLEQLALKGYQPVQDKAKAKYLAFLSYGIDGGQTSVSSSPVYGQIGGGTTYSSGTLSTGTRTGSYSGYSTTIPQFGVVGSSTYSTTLYKRQVALDIFVNGEEATAPKVFEVKATSTGTCGNISSIIDEIMLGMMQAFPGEPGKPTRVEVPWAGEC